MNTVIEYLSHNFPKVLGSKLTNPQFYLEKKALYHCKVPILNDYQKSSKCDLYFQQLSLLLRYIYQLLHCRSLFFLAVCASSQHREADQLEAHNTL